MGELLLSMMMNNPVVLCINALIAASAAYLFARTVRNFCASARGWAATDGHEGATAARQAAAETPYITHAAQFRAAPPAYLRHAAYYRAPRVNERLEAWEEALDCYEIGDPVTVEFAYRKPSGEVSRRVVDVDCVADGPRGVYLKGFCRLRGEKRTFSTGRIVGAITVRHNGEVVRVDEFLEEYVMRQAAVFEKS